jgi:hypothetical protein
MTRRGFAHLLDQWEELYGDYSERMGFTPTVSGFVSWLDNMLVHFSTPGDARLTLEEMGQA